jgi:hypothetical protein
LHRHQLEQQFYRQCHRLNHHHRLQLENLHLCLHQQKLLKKKQNYHHHPQYR